MEDLVGRIKMNGGTLRNVTVPGHVITKIFNDGYKILRNRDPVLDDKQ